MLCGGSFWRNAVAACKYCAAVGRCDGVRSSGVAVVPRIGLGSSNGAPKMSVANFLTLAATLTLPSDTLAKLEALGTKSEQKPKEEI